MAHGHSTGERTIVTICGSMRFYEQMLKEAERQTAMGRVVLMPFRTEHDEEQKGMHAVLQIQRIHMSNILVVASNYMGESTQSEIRYATTCGLEIEYCKSQEQAND